MSEQRFSYSLSFSDVIRVLRLVDETPFQEIQLELEGLKVRVVQDKEPRLPAQQAAGKQYAAEPAQAALPEPAPAPAIAAPVPVKGVEGTPVVAPLAGTFYRSPFPGEPPFVEVGTAVKAGDVVGILEIMKLMNHVTAPCSGMICEICARNEQFVEFGQVLALIGPERDG